MGLEETLDKLGDVPVYFTVDLDVLDPLGVSRHRHPGARRRDL